MIIEEQEKNKYLDKINKLVLSKNKLTEYESKILDYILEEIQIKINQRRLEYEEQNLENMHELLTKQVITCSIPLYKLNNLINDEKEFEEQKQILDSLAGKSISVTHSDEEGNKIWISANLFMNIRWNSFEKIFYVRVDPLLYCLLM